MILRELSARLGLEIDAASFEAANALLGTIRGGLIAIGTFAGAAAVGLAAAVAKTAEYADQIEKASKRTSIGVESLQALQYAAERADVGMGGLQAALNFMAREGIKDFEAELRRVADHIQRMPKDGARAAYAIEHLGRQGAMLLPMLSDGSAGLDEMTRKAREMGLVLSDEQIAGGAAVKDAIEDLQGYIRGLTYLIGVPLLKTARKWLEELSRWIRENRALIAQRIEVVLRWLAEGLRAVWQVTEPLREAVWGLGGALRRLWEEARELRVPLVTLGGILLAAFAPTFTLVTALALMLEEVWGWITGKRRTLLEDYLGTWDDFLRRFQDNPVTRAIEGWVRLLERTRDVIDEIKASLGLGESKVHTQMRAEAEAMRRAFEAAGATTPSQQFQLMRDPRIAELAAAGDFDAIRREYGPGGPRAVAPLGLPWREGIGRELPWVQDMRMRSGDTASPSLSVGSLTVNVGPPAGTDPAEWGNAVGKEIRTQLEQQLEDFWSGKMGEAATPAVR